MKLSLIVLSFASLAITAMLVLLTTTVKKGVGRSPEKVETQLLGSILNTEAKVIVKFSNF